MDPTLADTAREKSHPAGPVTRAPVAFAIAVLLIALGLAGCGASSPAAPPRASVAVDPGVQLRATVVRFALDVARRNPATACADMTLAFWAAMKGQLDGTLANGGQPAIPGSTCVRSLHYVFTRLPSITGSDPHASFSLEHVVLHGATAAATLVEGGPHPARFVRGPGGRWRIDCCTGRQLDQVPVVRYQVPSISMEPTLALKQLVTVDNSTLRRRPPAVGEVVTFHPPVAGGCTDGAEGSGTTRPCGVSAHTAAAGLEIKRVVGMPGDRIAIVGGRLVRNGTRRPEPYATPCSVAECNMPSAITVPPGSYFLLGDNRANSFDSRYFGPVPTRWIVGLVEH